jgi:hypothetical protein
MIIIGRILKIVPEVMTPLRDAMSFMHCHQANALWKKRCPEAEKKYLHYLTKKERTDKTKCKVFVP